jgi:hypothetical protein
MNIKRYIYFASNVLALLGLAGAIYSIYKIIVCAIWPESIILYNSLISLDSAVFWSIILICVAFFTLLAHSVTRGVARILDNQDMLEDYMIQKFGVIENLSKNFGYPEPKHPKADAAANEKPAEKA